MNWTQCLAVWSMWLLWAVCWVILARSAKPVVRRESDHSRRAQSIPLILGGMLLFLPDLGGSVFDARYLPAASAWAALSGLAAVLAGLLFTVWARVFLGGNWSVSVTLKSDHELVRGGPYRWVRHPIYSGVLLAAAGTALVGGQWRGLLGLALVAASLIYKVQIEESWLGEHFGEAYDRYRTDVAALIPCVY